MQNVKKRVLKLRNQFAGTLSLTFSCWKTFKNAVARNYIVSLWRSKAIDRVPGEPLNSSAIFKDPILLLNFLEIKLSRVGKQRVNLKEIPKSQQ